MTEQLEKKSSEEEMESQSQPNESGSAADQNVAVDTGKRVDVSKVVLKKNMVRDIHKPADSELLDATPVGLNEPQNAQQPAVHKPEARKKHHNQNAKKKLRPQKEIEVVRRPHQESHFNAESLTENTKSAPLITRPDPTIWDASGDFSAMLDAADPIQKIQVNLGDRYRCKMIHVAGETAFFSFASRYEGSMPLSELRRENGEYICFIGDEIDAYVVGLTNGILLSVKMGKNMADLAMLQEAKNAGIPVEGTICGVNSGGYEVALAGTKGFCPLGQIDTEFVQDPKSLIGKTFVFSIAKIGEGGRNIVLNRRKLLEHEKKKRFAQRIKEIKVGDRVEGRVVRLADFGAFIDLNGVEGLVPNSEIGHSRVNTASDRLSIDDVVQVEILKIEPDPKREGHLRIGLSLKAAMPDPFSLHADKIIPGQTLEGTVARLETFGAFVELFEGIDGLIHISELSDKRVSHPSEVLKPGDPVTVRVLDFDRNNHRISLSLRENVERERDREKVLGPALARGSTVDGVVERIERYGVFLKLSNGQTALLPSSETGTPKGADLAKFFELGSSLQALVIEIDDRGRVRVSKTAREKADERAVFDTFAQKQKRGSSSLGTLGDLLKDIKFNKR